MVDQERRITLWNSRAEALYGYTEAEVISRHVNLIVPEELREITDRFNEELLAEGKPITVECERIRKDGTVVSISMTLSPVRLADGTHIANAGIHRDLTGRKRAEEELVRAKNEAESANSAKSEFLSNMSHELRSPLNAVVGFSDIILLQSDQEKIRGFAEKIKDSGHYLTRLIEELLDLDRIDEGKVRLEMENISINDLVSEVAAAWQLRLPDEFSLRCELDFSGGPVFCDPTWIRQILTNLMENAVKYSHRGGLLTIRTEAKSEELWVSVQDEGMGIDPVDKEVIFDRFRQLESGYRRSAGGLGIGLNLVQKLVELHGGRVWVESKKDVGSVFTFSLPCPAVRQGEPDVGGKEGGSGGAEPWTGKRILLMDDVEHYHEYLRLLMDSAEAFYSAYNGLEGVEAAIRHKPDLVLMDLRMPVLDGFDTTARIKAAHETRNIPLVAVTAQATYEDKERISAAGADGFVTKPIGLQLFRKTLENIFR
ncbi:MAG: ATP-binding protein [Nitrospinota bacterium]|nr:ATP-binding protein [Nitrospinota bacterium]